MKKMIFSVGGKEIQCEEEWPAPSPATIDPITGCIGEVSKIEVIDLELWVEIHAGNKFHRVAIKGESPAWIFEGARVSVEYTTGTIRPVIPINLP
jgi:hypothetical protein